MLLYFKNNNIKIYNATTNRDNLIDKRKNILKRLFSKKINCFQNLLLGFGPDSTAHQPPRFFHGNSISNNNQFTHIKMKNKYFNRYS